MHIFHTTMLGAGFEPQSFRSLRSLHSLLQIPIGRFAVADSPVASLTASPFAFRGA